MIARRPGQHLEGQLKRLLVTGGLVLGLAILLAVLGFVWWPFSLLALPVLAFIRRAIDTGGRLDPFPTVRGLSGERRLAAAFEPLRDDGYWILNDVETGRGNVDHVIGGPNGVFAIEAKAWSQSFYPHDGRLFNGGRDCSQVLGQALSGAMAIKARLVRDGLRSPWVDALVVSTHSAVKAPSRGYLEFGRVRVLALDRLVAEIRDRKPRYTEPEVHRIRATILRWDLGPLRVRSISQE